MLNEIPSISDSIAKSDKLKFPRKEKIITKQCWLTPQPAFVEKKLLTKKLRLQVLFEQLKFYCDNSSLAGYKYITEIHRTTFERY